MEENSTSFSKSASDSEICILEPFYGGSHKQLIDLIIKELNLMNFKFDLFTMSAKKWHWRARCSALYFSCTIPKSPHKYRVLLASSVLNLAELIALRPDLARLEKIVYFHENQLIYPTQKKSTRNKNEIENKEQRDFQYGYNQILTSLVADKIYFNSNFNKTSFLAAINTFLKLQPDYRVKVDIERDLVPKCRVLYFPIDIDQAYIDSIINQAVLSQLLDTMSYQHYLNRPINILWSNRWEHDKNPDEFFNVLFKLHEMNVDFRLYVLGEQFSEIPEIFNEAKTRLSAKIESWGYMASKEEYYRALAKCDLVVSTSLHEFFGVSLLEACLFGVYPLVPNRLVYPEIYPKQCLYSTESQLLKKLKYICTRPQLFRSKIADNKQQQSTFRSSSDDEFISIRLLLNTYISKFKWSELKSQFVSSLFASIL